RRWLVCPLCRSGPRYQRWTRFAEKHVPLGALREERRTEGPRRDPFADEQRARWRPHPTRHHDPYERQRHRNRAGPVEPPPEPRRKMLPLPPITAALSQTEEQAHHGKQNEEHRRRAEVNPLDRVFAPPVLKWRQPSMEVGRVACRKQRNEDRTQTSEERGGVIEVPVCDLVRDQEDAGRAHDHDEDVAHSGVVVDTERTARMRVAAKGKPVREREPEWKHEPESADAEAHHEVRAHVLRLTRLLRRFWTRSNVRHGPQEIGHRHVPTLLSATARNPPTSLATKARTASPRCSLRGGGLLPSV